MRAIIIAALLLATAASAQEYAGRSQSCATKACNPTAAVALYCSTDVVAPFRGPAPSGSCRECAGSTLDPMRCGAPTATTTTSSSTTTTAPSPTTTTSTTRPKPTTTTTTLPEVSVCQPNGIDISARWGKQEAALYFPRSSPNVRWASQQERDCIEQARMELDNQLSWTVGDLAPGAAKGTDGVRTLAYTRIEVRTPYRGTTFATKGATWIHPPQGRLYQEPGQVVMDYRAELTKPAVRARAAERLASAPNLRNYLDVNATLTGPAEFPTYEVPKADPTKRAQSHPVDTRKKFPPCGGGNGCVDLHATHQAHACAAARKLAGLGYGPGPGAECDGVPVPAVAHVKYEAGCGGDEECQWLRRMRFFSGFQDRTSWSPLQLAQLATLEDIVHGHWMAAQAAGDAPRSEQTSGQHDELHAMENDGAGWFAVYPWDNVAPSDYLEHQGNRVLSPADLLALLVVEYGVTLP